MSADHDEFAAVLLARKVITSEKLVEAWQLASRRKVPVEDALVMLGHATSDEVNAARAALDRSRWLDYVDLLVREQILTAEQLEEARSTCRGTGAGLAYALVRLGYVSEVQLMKAVAEANGLPFIDLSDVTIPPAIIELMPESVARENVVLPLAVDGDVLKVITSDPADVSTLEKLQFILNKQVSPVVAVREQIVEAINRHYDLSETESVDSMLAEFTDTAIDFTQTEATAGCSIDLEFCDDERECEVYVDEDAAPAPAAPRPVERRATVRYYHRMNPQRTFPLLVILSRHEVAAVVKRGVSQAQSQAFRIEEGSLVEIEPVLPGCACFPPREQVRVGAGEVSVTFWVVPQVLGRVMQARVVVRQEGDVLAEVPLEMAVVEQSLTRLMGALSLVLPFVLFVLKQYGLDFDSQKEQDFSLYAEVARWLLARLTPEVLTGLLLAATVGLYFWLRPRRRDVFWDVKTREPAPAPIAEAPKREGAVAPAPSPRATAEDLLERARAAFGRGEEREGERLLGELLAARPLDTAVLLLLAERREKAGKYATAVVLYERALATGRGDARAYFRASLAAHLSGDTARALDVLKEAETDLPPDEMRGPMWYNMGCFAARLGRFPEALRYLNRAVDRGFDDLDKFRADPDLEPLRWHAGFRRLLAEVGR